MKKLMATGCAAVLLSACTGVTALSDDQYAYLSGRTVYAQVSSIVDASSSDGFGAGSDYCKAYSDPSCGNIKAYNTVKAVVSRGWIRMNISYLQIPKTEHVQVGDIIKYVITPSKGGRIPWNRFTEVAHSVSDADSETCQFSSVLTIGGVICDGWDYRQDMPKAAKK